jgi:hypothetical protein
MIHLAAPSMSAGDGPAGGQEGWVVQVVLLAVQVAGAFIGAGAFGGAVAAVGGTAADPGADVAVPAVQELGGLVFHPGAGVGITGVEERVRCFPDVFQLSAG